MGAAGMIKRILWKRLSLERYLKTVSAGYFTIYRLGLSRAFATYEYPRFLRRLVGPGDTVIDIGANLGYYSWFFARLAGPDGRVYAVEPVVPIAAVLRHNLRRFGNVEVLNYALGAEDKSIVMGNDSAPGGHFATGRNYVSEGPGSAAMEFASEMRKGSELFGRLDRLDMIKCDIEGYEGVVIPEMEPVIDRHLPLVLIESGGDTRKEIARFFEGKGYNGYVLERGRLRPASAGDSKDLVFIHSSKSEKYRKLYGK